MCDQALFCLNENPDCYVVFFSLNKPIYLNCLYIVFNNVFRDASSFVPPKGETGSSVVLENNTGVVAEDNTCVVAEDNTCVVVEDNTYVAVEDNTGVVAEDNTCVTVEDNDTGLK
ncbi:MAG TPA: hypothetical protein PKV15_07215 [Syntrophomonadaceae bacterium]|jgi:hypothetical protein|nr:hypothetical protein [Syntrophomonadaceae bacterium]HRX21264.1 hypothetical protein [Syntrophomonadaceae bacterium]